MKRIPHWLKVACGALLGPSWASPLRGRLAPSKIAPGDFVSERGHMTALDPAAQGAALGRLLTCCRNVVVAAVLLGSACACAPIEPWVKPYEREHLADPIMALERNPIASTYLDHVFETREGARGATGAVGGGCGCN